MDIHYKVPQKWDDLSEWQVRMIGKFLFTNRNVQTEKVFMKRIMVVILLIDHPSLKIISKAVFLLSQISLVQLESYSDFIFDKAQYLTRFPNKIKVGRWPFRKTLYGPSSRLANVSIEELNYADTFYYRWMTEDKEVELHRLAAILYRPKSKKPLPYDVRTEFSSLLLEGNADVSDRIPLHIKFMIAHAYQGCREIMINRYKNVFPRKKPVEGETPKPTKKKTYQPFSRIIDTMAMDEVQVFGNHQQVKKVLAPEFLAVYDELIVRQREREQNKK